MSKREKKMQAIRANPKNVRFEMIQSVLLSYGFIETVPGGGSSHYTYHKGIYRITVPKDNPVNKIYVLQVIKIIDKMES